MDVSIAQRNTSAWDSEVGTTAGSASGKFFTMKADISNLSHVMIQYVVDRRFGSTQPSEAETLESILLTKA